MKKIYFIVTDTGTMLSRIVKFFMKDEFGHVSISLDKKLRHMYSFGRLNPYNPFYGGLVHESIKRGTFKRFHKTKARILEYEITDEQYTNVKKEILKLKKNRRELRFNVLGLFAIYFKIKRRKDDCFYCAEFVKHLIEKANIDIDLPELVRPEDFKNLEGSTVIYEGLLKEYK